MPSLMDLAERASVAGGVVTAGRTHNLKCWPEPFAAMQAGEKTAEFRLDDRGFQVGDVLLIREWCPDSKTYTHREITRTVTHILRDEYGVPKGYAMLSLAAMPPPPASGAGEVERHIQYRILALSEPPRSAKKDAIIDELKSVLGRCATLSPTGDRS